MKFVDLEFENKRATNQSTSKFQEIESSGKYLLDKNLENFEIEFAKDQSKKYCIGVKNATDALAIAFKLLESDKRTVIVPQFGAYPTVIAAIQANSKSIIAAPVDSTLCLDLKNINIPKGSILVPVNLFGNESNIKEIREIADANDCLIVEDCAQSTGIPTNDLSDICVHSFYPTKPLGSKGDGGALLTNNDVWATQAKKARFYGLSSGVIDSWGFNSRMDEWQSCHLVEKIGYYRELNQKRKDCAKKYNDVILNPGLTYTKNCVYHQYVTIWKNRDAIQQKLLKKGIPTMIHYPKMLYDMPFLKDKVVFVDYAKRISDHILSLPVGPHLKQKDIEKITNVLSEIKEDILEFNDV